MQKESFGRAGGSASSLRSGLRTVARATASLVGALAVAGFALPALGQSAGVQAMIDKQLEQIPSGEDGINQIMTELTSRLTLSDEQQKDIRPPVADALANMEKSRDRFKAGELTPMALGMQLQMALKKSAVLIEPVLNEEQKLTYKTIQQEQRRQMMKAMSQSGAMGGAAK